MKEINIKEIFSLGWKSFKKHWVFLVLATMLLAVIDQIVDYGFTKIFPDVDKFLSDETGDILMTKSIGIKMFVISIISGIVSMFFYGWFTKETLNIVDDKKPTWNMANWAGNFEESFLRVLKTIGYYIIFILPVIVVGGIIGLIITKTILLSETTQAIVMGLFTIALVIYMVYFAIYSGFAYFMLIDKKIGVIEAIKESFALVGKNRTAVFSYYGRLILYVILFAVAFGVISGILGFSGSLGTLIAVILLATGVVILTTWIALTMAKLYRELSSQK